MPKVRETADEIIIRCPGCGSGHRVPKSRWTLSGTPDRPTIHPSIVETVNPTDRKDYRPDCQTTVCHCVITDGRIHFCGDSTHAMRNQTVELLDVLEVP